MELIGYLYALGCLQGLILCVVLLLAPGIQRPANYFMAGLVAMISLRLLQSWLISSDVFLEDPQWLPYLMPLNYAWGPLLYLYAHSLSLGPLRWSQAAHFIPVVIFFIGYQNAFPSDLQLQKDLVKSIWYEGAQVKQTLNATPAIVQVWIEYHLKSVLFFTHFGIYCLLILRALKQHNQVLKAHFSSLEKMNLRWLKWLTIACLLYLAMFLFMGDSPVLVQGDATDFTAYRYLYLVVLLYAIAIAAIFQPNIIRGTLAARTTSQLPTDSEPQTMSQNQHNHANKANNNDQSVTEKYQHSALSPEATKIISQCLEKAMEREELYLKDDLTLPDLAKAAEITTHQASQVLNSELNKNFYSFVNHYRIEKAKQLLTEKNPRIEKIVDIAMEVGFKSKSSFYDAFKKETQMTPTQFKNKTKNSQSQ